MLHPYEFSPSCRAIYTKITKVLLLVESLAAILTATIWGVLLFSAAISFVRTCLFRAAVKKNAGQWLQERLSAQTELLFNLLVATGIVIATVFVFHAVRQFLKYTRGAWIHGMSNLLMAADFAYLTLLYYQKASIHDQWVILVSILVIAVPVMGIVQGWWCKQGKANARQWAAQAKQAWESKQPQEATVLLEKALAQDPFQIEALYLLGEIEATLHPQQAGVIWEAALKMGNILALATPEITPLLQTIRQRLASIQQQNQKQQLASTEPLQKEPKS